MTIKNEDRLKKFLKSGFLVQKDLIDKSLCDAILDEAIANENPNIYIHQKRFRSHKPITPSESTNSVVKQISKEFEYVLKNFLEETYLTELGTILAYPGAEAQGVHRDVPNEDIKFISIFVNLLDVSPENGPLTLYPKSQNKFPLKRVELDAIDPFQMALRKGSVILYDSRIYHYGAANTSNSSVRPVFYFSYGATDVNGPVYCIENDLKGKYKLNDFI